MTTEVVFKKFKEGDVIAIFPNEKWSENQLTSYMSIGQHGGCHPDMLNELEDANPNEYGSLFNELTKAIGYKLKIVK